MGPVPLGLIFGLITGAGGAAIVMRTAALKVAAKPFMEAAHVAGGSALHVMVKHFLPNMLPLAALQMMIAVSGAVVADGFISFFGLKRVTLNWGTLIYDAFLYSNIGGSGTQWHVLVPAAMAFTFFALAFYLVSRGLHKVADPQLRDES
jgi:peptide/nickel transport system permease protein